MRTNIYYPSLSDNVLTIPAIVPPPDLSAEITFLAGDCNNPIISPRSSSLDLISTNVSN